MVIKETISVMWARQHNSTRLHFDSLNVPDPYHDIIRGVIAYGQYSLKSSCSLRTLLEPRELINKINKRYFILIHQTSSITVTWHYLGWYRIQAKLAFIFMLLKHIISARWACQQGWYCTWDKLLFIALTQLMADDLINTIIGILCWFTKLVG